MSNIDTLADAIVVAGSKNQPFVVSYSDFKGRKLLDVRKYYKDKKTGEVRPTQKGVALNRLQFEVLHHLFQEKANEIEEWFELEETEKSSEIRALEESRLSGPEAEIVFETWVGLEMFRYERRGNSALLQLNVRHPWVKRFQEMYESEEDSKQPSVMLVTTLLDSFFRSVALIDPKNEHANEVLETLIGNWGIFSRRGK